MAQTTGLGNASAGQCNQSNRKPRLMSTPKEADTTWVDATAVVYDFSQHFSNDVVTYAITVAPTGMTLDVNTGILSGTATGLAAGRPIVTATNANGDTAVIVDWQVVAA